MVDNVNTMRDKVDKVNQFKVNSSAEAPPAGSGEVLDQLHALMHRVKRHFQQAARTLPEGLAPMEWRVLEFFGRHPGASARDLVAHSGRDKAQVARLVRSLVERGLLSAAASAADQRSQELRVTDAGREIAAQLSAERRRIERSLTRALPAPERAELARLLARLHEALGEP